MSTQAFRISFVVGARKFKNILDKLGAVSELKIEAVDGSAPIKSWAKRVRGNATPIAETKAGKAALAAFVGRDATNDQVVAALRNAGLAASSASPTLSRLRNAGKIVRAEKNLWRLA